MYEGSNIKQKALEPAAVSGDTSHELTLGQYVSLHGLQDLFFRCPEAERDLRGK